MWKVNDDSGCGPHLYNWWVRHQAEGPGPLDYEMKTLFTLQTTLLRILLDSGLKDSVTWIEGTRSISCLLVVPRQLVAALVHQEHLVILLDPKNSPSVMQGKPVPTHFTDVGAETKLSELPTLNSLCEDVCLQQINFYVCFLFYLHTNLLSYSVY